MIKLFGSNDPKWCCRNCGFTQRAVETPEECPECNEWNTFSVIIK